MMGKPIGIVPLGRSSCRWKANIKIGLKEMETVDMD
jgi:hypothetical protein